MYIKLKSKTLLLSQAIVFIILLETKSKYNMCIYHKTIINNNDTTTFTSNSIKLTFKTKSNGKKSMYHNTINNNNSVTTFTGNNTNNSNFTMKKTNHCSLSNHKTIIIINSTTTFTSNSTNLFLLNI